MYRCSADGCSSHIVNGGVCMRHGAKMKLCSSEGCANYAKNGGLCIRHGAKVARKLCNREGCSNQAVRGGVCVRHGAKVKRCSSVGCTNQAQKGGLCKRHGHLVKSLQQEFPADGRTGRQPQQLQVVSPFSSSTMAHQQHTPHRHVSLSSPSNQTHFIFNGDVGWVCRHCYPLDRYNEPNFARLDVAMSWLHPPPTHFVEAHLRICPVVNNQSWASRREATTTLGSGLSSSGGGMTVEQFLHLQQQQQYLNMLQGLIKTNVKGRAIAPSDIHNSSSTADSSNIRSLVANSGQRIAKLNLNLMESESHRHHQDRSIRLPQEAQKGTDALLMDVPIKLSKEEFALSMGLNRGGSVAVKVAQNMLRQEECTSGMEQRSKSDNAAAKGVQTFPSTEECVEGTEQRSNDAALKGVQI